MSPFLLLRLIFNIRKEVPCLNMPDSIFRWQCYFAPLAIKIIGNVSNRQQIGGIVDDIYKQIFLKACIFYVVPLNDVTQKHGIF
jgi:hypothetical protein